MPSLEQPPPLQIDEGQCVGCAICADVCPTTALTMEAADLRPIWRADQCTLCGDCVHECPTAAIRLNGTPT